MRRRTASVLVAVTSRRFGVALLVLAVLGAVALSGLQPSTAEAHLGHVVLRAERYLKLDVEPQSARFVVSLTLGADETVRVLVAADADEDGEVTPSEAEAYVLEWGRALSEELLFELDGEPFGLDFSEPWLDPLGPTVPAPSMAESLSGVVELVAMIPLDGGRHILRWRDRMDVSRFDRTDVVVSAQPGVTLHAVGPSEHPSDLDERFAYASHDVPEVVTAIVEVAGLSPIERALVFVAVGLTAMLVVAAWIALALRRRRGDAA